MRSGFSFVMARAMGRYEYFSKVIKVVTELTEVPREDILSGEKYAAAVDARRMVIYLMHEKKYTTRDIAPLLAMTRRSINIAIAAFPDRMYYSADDLHEKYIAAKEMLGKSEEKAGK